VVGSRRTILDQSLPSRRLIRIPLFDLKFARANRIGGASHGLIGRKPASRLMQGEAVFLS
jgi:hypothetical protein